MKCKLQILFAILAVAILNIGAINAQSLQLVSVESSVTTAIPTSAKSHPTVKNISGTPINVQIVVNPISLGEGHLYQVCTPLNCFFPTATKFTSEEFQMKADEVVTGSYTAIVLTAPNVKPGVTVLDVKYYNATDENDKIEYTLTFTVTEKSNVVSETWVRNADVFPNPATEKVVLRMSDALASNATLKVYNSFGDLVITNELSAGTANFEVNTIQLLSGSYHFAIESGNGVINSGSFTVVK